MKNQMNHLYHERMVQVIRLDLLFSLIDRLGCILLLDLLGNDMNLYE